jgi:hypothetical protein
LLACPPCFSTHGTTTSKNSFRKATVSRGVDASARAGLVARDHGDARVEVAALDRFGRLEQVVDGTQDRPGREQDQLERDREGDAHGHHAA